MSHVTLRPVEDPDLEVFFEQQRDPVANEVAAFPARDRETFMAHQARVRSDPSVLLRTIVLEDGQVAGNVVSFVQDGHREVGYWIGRQHWGVGIATAALHDFLTIEIRRPLHAWVAKGNIGSQRVLEKCGFTRAREEDKDLVYELR